MDGWEVDPLKLWDKIMKLWNAPGFKDCLRSCRASWSVESSSDEEEEFAFVNWTGNMSSHWSKYIKSSKGGVTSTTRTG